MSNVSFPCLRSWVEVSLSFTKSNPALWSESRALDNLKAINSKRAWDITNFVTKSTLPISCPVFFFLFFSDSDRISTNLLPEYGTFFEDKNDHIRNQQNMMVTMMEGLEHLSIRIKWMNNLAQIDAFLESLNFALGDLRPENVPLDRNRLKLSEFDCTGKIETIYEGCAGCVMMRQIKENVELLAFLALGENSSLSVPFEVSEDRFLTKDTYDHNPKVLKLLQSMGSPTLDGNSLIDYIITNVGIIICHGLKISRAIKHAFGREKESDRK
ncbi:hypothetical protein N7490_010726 [Penicillium lividum]|nr:hypothetical protein N7490_010726 [Penicillium lividum]